jgi:chemotaxis signal transduction protein
VEWLQNQGAKANTPIIVPKHWFCFFHGDAGPMAVSMESVVEILETDSLVRLPWSPPQVVGMCSYHREVVPVVRFAPPPRSAQDDPSSEPDQPATTDRWGETAGTDEKTRHVVLILKTEHGEWGIRVDPAKTIMSRESPEFHSPRMEANGPVLIGVVPFAGISHGILDAEATWRELRAAVSRWSALIKESSPSSPLACGEELSSSGPNDRRETWEA